MTVGKQARKGINMSATLTSLIGLVTSSWTAIAAWVPILFGIGFVIVRFALGAISRIAGFRRKRGRAR